MRLAPGTLLGPYEVLALLGTGGMAEVYRARDTRLGREVAIKVVSESLGGHGAWLERLQREAQLAGALNHPNVVSLYDVGVHDTRPFFVTELLEGESLRERLHRGPVPIATALEWAGQVAQGLAAAHERGIVHRDLKPENLFLTRAGHVKLLDFGIAKLVEAVQRATSPHALMDETLAPSVGATDTGVVLGTPGYMSPEQVRGDPRRRADRPLQPGRHSLRDALRPAGFPGQLLRRERLRHPPLRSRAAPRDDRPGRRRGGRPLPGEGAGATVPVGT